ncbi:hypothetical protein WCE34_01105 [Luteimonas sp. MJ204]|uniref:hypothetical protein n=1 Tax=Luteimonas TaxID=83614 RepID=UPI0031B9C2D1
MAKSNPTRPDAPAEESSLDDGTDLPETRGPKLKDPRATSAMDNIGVDTGADLLDVALDDQPGDVDADGRSFADDVRSDTISDDEGRERR